MRTRLRHVSVVVAAATSVGLFVPAGVLPSAAGTPLPASEAAPRWARVEGVGAAVPADERAIDAMIARMTVRQKAAQMIMPWMPGGLDPGSREYRRAERSVASLGVGGLIVGKGDRHTTARVIRALQRRSRVPLLVASDLEWGAGMRLLGATLLPPAMAVSAAGDTALAYAYGRVTAAEGRASGLHMTLGPVLDVNNNPRNPIINTRSFGEDPRAVAQFGAAVIRGLQDGGLLAVGKHFPGHGDTDEDSHLALPTIAATRARLDSVELAPFRAAIQARIAGIMVGHIAAPALGTGRAPASLSRSVATTVLRGEMQFDGLVMTDALNMAGVARGRETAEIALRAVAAGADILLQPKDADVAIDAIVNAVSRGEITRERLDASVRRVLRAKARVGLIGGSPAARTLAEAARRQSSPGDVADSISARSITLLRDRAGLLPVEASRPVLSLTYASGVGVPGGASEAFDATLRKAGARVTSLTLPLRTATAVTDSLLRAWDDGALSPLVILSSYTLPIPGRGSVGLPDAVAESVERIAQRTTLIYVAFGGPYVTASVPSASTVVLAWSGIPSSQRAAARVILGARSATGRLPVSLLPDYAVGHGVLAPEPRPNR